MKACVYHFKFYLRRILCLWTLLNKLNATHLLIKQQYGQFIEYLNNHVK